ncbi:biotin--[acetyl-CoA-carboxylase] ligase [Acholeplasma equirhinis]|uniref:biotin--[acetyl-CoA-carboxylase] ligase n=1 Tax=Acholeplasma equirhinis TaxID=555393 RepID=UPI00197A9A30|nr:biotin--[acetyl-CoA-carboxylase] ligase [Acholeplasma equirhinis]MBN3490195.1 biotin--[acetyl-CoA-carboxylase] ligase [Acholeplasma equirhinis]
MAKLKIVELKQVDSTNDYLKKHYQELPSFTVVRTDYQTAGRGQFERRWNSARGKNLLFSLLLKDVPFDQIITIKEWVKSSIFSLLGSYGLDVYFKEPNDVYVDDKKICGILIETKSTEKNFEYVIVGIGLNVNQLLFSGFKATSLTILTKKMLNVRSVFSKLIANLLESYF